MDKEEVLAYLRDRLKSASSLPRTRETKKTISAPRTASASAVRVAVAINIGTGDTPVVLLSPPWKHWGAPRTVKPRMVTLADPWFEVFGRTTARPPVSPSSADHLLVE